MEGVRKVETKLGLKSKNLRLRTCSLGACHLESLVSQSTICVLDLLLFNLLMQTNADLFYTLSACSLGAYCLGTYCLSPQSRGIIILLPCKTKTLRVLFWCCDWPKLSPGHQLLLISNILQNIPHNLPRNIPHNISPTAFPATFFTTFRTTFLITFPTAFLVTFLTTFPLPLLSCFPKF